MAPLKFCANISWLFTELPDFSQRIYAAASAGFRAVEAAWLYESDLEQLQRAREATGVEVVLINTPPGRVPEGSHRTAVAKEMEAIFVQNLNYAADIFSKEGITGLIEPINTRMTDPRYFLDSPHQAAAILEKVGKPNIKLQMRVPPLELIKTDSSSGHVQIAQVPGRNEPDSDGELNYRYLFDTLENLHYQGYVGCEYKPLGSTEEGLGWMKE
ncbi:putative hydroxypyruvate isomerase [Liparis tanakae]|uniref:Putative hydroxypyruvate isomerase n=1 Tax=Liparis tanakae TaxID=230148 RepID=A0A4Z2IJX3_9TELE|nr:putative hydroxypyruvate isomerase [Liparis tanakae]